MGKGDKKTGKGKIAMGRLEKPSAQGQKSRTGQSRKRNNHSHSVSANGFFVLQIFYSI